MSSDQSVAMHLLSERPGLRQDLLNELCAYTDDLIEVRNYQRRAQPKPYHTGVTTVEWERDERGTMKRIPWTEDEDRILITGVLGGSTWVDIHKAGQLPRRFNVHMKDRYRTLVKKYVEHA